MDAMPACTLLALLIDYADVDPAKAEEQPGGLPNGGLSRRVSAWQARLGFTYPSGAQMSGMPSVLQCNSDGFWRGAGACKMHVCRRAAGRPGRPGGKAIR